MKRYAPLVVGVAAALLFVRLGIWQLERRQQRLARNAEIERAMGMDVIEVGEGDGWGPEGPAVSGREWSPGQPMNGAERARAREGTPRPPSIAAAYRRGRATGRFDFERQIVVMLKSLDGIPGVYIVTPLVLESGAAVLVERGWVASPDGRRVDLGALAEPASTLAEGILLAPASDRSVATVSWPLFVREADPARLGGALPYPVYPLVLRRTVLPAGAPQGMRALRPPRLDEGPHLSYALQWFGFAVIAVVGSAMLVARRN